MPGRLDCSTGCIITALALGLDFITPLFYHFSCNSRLPGRFFFESERGLFPNTEFVFDLELPLDFVPFNSDGEVECFELLPAKVLAIRHSKQPRPTFVNWVNC
jgi:hypothetical protein